MFELIKKTMLAGIGFTAVAESKAEELIKEYIKKGEITERQGKALVDEFVKKTEHSRKDVETRLEDMVQKILKKMDIATRGDIVGLDRRLKRMEQKTVKEKKTSAIRGKRR